jgi:hypothetical protein
VSSFFILTGNSTQGSDENAFPRTRLAKLVLLLLALFSCLPLPWALAQPTGAELAQSIFDRYVGDDMTSHQIMELIPAKGQPRVRELDITGADRGGLRRSLLRSPRRRTSRTPGF